MKWQKKIFVQSSKQMNTSLLTLKLLLLFLFFKCDVPCCILKKYFEKKNIFLVLDINLIYVILLLQHITLLLITYSITS